MKPFLLTTLLLLATACAPSGLLRELEGHRGDVNVVAFSPDGTLVASTGQDRSLRLWKTRNGELLDALRPSARIVGDKLKPVISKDRETGPAALSGEGIRALAFLSNGDVAVQEPDGAYALLLVRPKDGELVGTIPPPGSRKEAGQTGKARAVDRARDDSRLAVAMHDGTVQVWRRDATSEPLVVRFSEGLDEGRRKSLAEVEKLIAKAQSGAPQDELDALHAQRLAILGDLSANGLKLGNRIDSVALSGDGGLVAVAGSHKNVVVFETAKGTTLERLEHPFEVAVVTFAPSGDLVATGCPDGSVRLWSARTGELKHELPKATGSILAIAFSPSGALCATASLDGKVRLHTTRDAMLVETYRGHEGGARSVAFSPDGALLVTGGADQIVRIWSVPTKEH